MCMEWNVKVLLLLIFESRPACTLLCGENMEYAESHVLVMQYIPCCKSEGLAYETEPALWLDPLGSAPHSV